MIEIGHVARYRRNLPRRVRAVSPAPRFRALAGAVAFGAAVFHAASSLAAFPTPSTTGTAQGWTPKATYTRDVRITRAGAVLEDVRLLNADLVIAADNVIVRRVDIQGGRIINYTDGRCHNGLMLVNVTIRRAPGQVTRTSDPPAIGLGGYTAVRVKIDGLPEGFRVGGPDQCQRVLIRDSFARIVAPDRCTTDWRGDALQGHEGPKVIVRNVTLHLVDRPDCPGSAAFLYPGGRGNTYADIDGLLVRGGRYPFWLGTPGVVRGLRIGSGSWMFVPIGVRCSLVTAWEAKVVDVSANYQPTRLVRRQSCNTEAGGRDPEFPDALTTGVHPGLALRPSGSITINTPGAVVSGLDVTGSVVINAPNVTLRNIRVRATSWGAIVAQASGARIEDCEISSIDPDGGTKGVIFFDSATGGSVRRCDIHDVEDGVYISTRNVVVEDNYIHDLHSAGPDPHYDGIQLYGGVTRDVIIRHNSVIVARDHNSAVGMGTVQNVQVDRNRLHGGGYTIHVDGRFGGGIVSNVSITNNRFGTYNFGRWTFERASPRVLGNVDDVTGSPVP
jgi:hypothetical protein